MGGREDVEQRGMRAAMALVPPGRTDSGCGRAQLSPLPATYHIRTPHLPHTTHAPLLTPPHHTHATHPHYLPYLHHFALLPTTPLHTAAWVVRRLEKKTPWLAIV